jgi:hypothetical protein
MKRFSGSSNGFKPQDSLALPGLQRGKYSFPARYLPLILTKEALQLSWYPSSSGRLFLSPRVPHHMKKFCRFPDTQRKQTKRDHESLLT